MSLMPLFHCADMPKQRLVYLWSLRNAAADRAGQLIPYRGETRYMKSPLEYLVEALGQTPLGDAYSLEAVIHDDDEGSSVDREKLSGYGFGCRPGQPWFFPPSLAAPDGRPLADLLQSVPSAYRRLPIGAPGRVSGKRDYERRLLDKLLTLGADLVVLDGLLIILDELVRPGSLFHRRVVNIHPGITRLGSPWERRGAWATLDALHGAQGRKVTDWTTMASVPVPPVNKTGASFHYVDNGIDSGEVIHDVLGTDIEPGDTILELRWNNFNRSLFPALHEGLALLARGPA
jgi:folate-dependent phosphoribosylglycinamide formyltransferase PurN